MSQSIPQTSNVVKLEEEIQVSRFRRILPQVIATTVNNLLLIQLAFIVTFPTILIAATTGMSSKNNIDESCSFTSIEASWIGSIAHLFEPIGCLLSAFSTDSFGRKRSMLFVNISLAFGWLMIYQGSALWHILSGFAILGLSLGLMGAPAITYIGEICEPSTRGVLLAYLTTTGPFGMFIVYLLNTMTSWRLIALICSAMPVITVIAMCFIPETPQWLLSKNRVVDAERSLCWLRGWVSSEFVAKEFLELKLHSKRSNSCNVCIKQDLKCTHPLPTIRQKFTELTRKQTLKPFIIIVSLFFITQFSGIYSMNPFLVQIFEAYESPIPPEQALAVKSFLENCFNFMYIFLVLFTGKRRNFLAMSLGIFLCSIILSCYGFIYLPSGYISFDQKHQSFRLENSTLSYIPLICLILWSSFSYCGYLALPWMMLSELFPFKSRGIATVVAASLNYVMSFISIKAYYNLETTFSLPGASLFFSVVSGLGLVVMYIILPETENRSLEDIEHHFSDNSKKITDRTIELNKKMHSKDIESCQ